MAQFDVTVTAAVAVSRVIRVEALDAHAAGHHAAQIAKKDPTLVWSLGGDIQITGAHLDHVINIDAEEV